MKRFPWIFTVLWLVILMIMIVAGFWQLNRAEEKQQIKQRMAAGETYSPKSSPDWQQLQAFDPIEIQGRYGNTHFLLDNQIMDGQVGFFVLTSFQTTDGIWLLVNRGWTDNDEQLFDVEPTKQKITALLADWPRPGIQLGEQDIENQAMQHVTYLAQQPTTELLKQRHCQQIETENCIILSSVLKLDPSMVHGFERQWQLPRMTVEKHRGYAIQWFSMSLVLCLFYAFFIYKNYASKD